VVIVRIIRSTCKYPNRADCRISDVTACSMGNHRWEWPSACLRLKTNLKYNITC